MPYCKPGKESKDVDFIVLEIAEKGEIFDFISNTGLLEEDTARYFFKQMLEAL